MDKCDFLDFSIFIISIFANENDIIPLQLFDRDKELISFDYISNKEESLQSFTNENVKLTFSFSYQRFFKKQNLYILCCPSFTIIKHPDIWSNDDHYNQCGQSCPCCRAKVGDTLGACPICK